MQHLPRKRFGQNFLVDDNITGKIVHAIRPQPDDRLVEIGPGRGALTYPLLEQLDQLHVIEIDRDLCAKFEQTPKLVVHCADVLKFDFATLSTDSPIRVVGNLPYNISTPLLFHLFRYCDHVIDMHFMLQKEVVDRLVAAPHSKSYGRLSVMTQYYADVQKLFEVAPGAFYPAPKVTSAVIRLVPRRYRELPVEHENRLAQLVQQAFSQRRKTLRNNMKPLMSDEAIRSCGIDPSVRAETLTLMEFIRLLNCSIAAG